MRERLLEQDHKSAFEPQNQMKKNDLYLGTQQSEFSDVLEILSALSDPDRLRIYLGVCAAGADGISEADIGAQLGFVQRRTARALRWLKRAHIIHINDTTKSKLLTVNLSAMGKLKNIL